MHYNIEFIKKVLNRQKNTAKTAVFPKKLELCLVCATTSILYKNYNPKILMSEIVLRIVNKRYH